MRAEVVSIDGMSAHADGAQVLQWLGPPRARPPSVFGTHGEPAAADALRQRIERQLHCTTTVPLLGQTAEPDGGAAAQARPRRLPGAESVTGPPPQCDEGRPQ